MLTTRRLGVSLVVTLTVVSWLLTACGLPTPTTNIQATADAAAQQAPAAQSTPTPTARGRVRAVTIPTPTPTLTPASTPTMRPPDTYPFPIQLINLRVLSARCRLLPEVPSFAVSVNVVAVRTTAEIPFGGIDPVALLTVMTADGLRTFETTVDPAFANSLREIRFGTLPWERSKRIDHRFEYKMMGGQFQFAWVKEIADHDGELLCKLDFRADPYFDRDSQLAYRSELGSVVLAVE